ncbi:phage tail protein, partial [Leclercia sp. LSNIH5]
MATLDDDLAKAVSEGFRLAQSSIINQDLILSGTGDVTVTLADGSKKTGPSWSKLIAAATAAGTSAAAAKTSETNALASKNAAATSATNAATSEGNALASKNAAKTSETNAKTSETNAKTSETNAAASASSAAASLAAAQLLTSVPYEEAPFPDVWAPLNDDLRLLAGFAPYDRLTISGQVLELPTKSLTFSRATTATYIDKSGVLRIAAINEPRF